MHMPAFARGIAAYTFGRTAEVFPAVFCDHHNWIEIPLFWTMSVSEVAKRSKKLPSPQK